MNRKKLTVTGLTLGLLLGQTACFSGCGSQPAAADEVIELIEPAGDFTVSETVLRRTLRTAEVYDVLVDPYIEEYICEETGTYVPGRLTIGDEVRKGEIIYRVELSAKEKAEELQEKLDSLTESYEEYKKEIEEELDGQRWQLQMLREQLEEVEDREPKEQSGAAYAAWQREYQAVLGDHNKKELDVNMNEEALRQRTELYQLDYQYYAARRQEAVNHNAEGTIRAGMDGQIVEMKLAADGETIPADIPVAKVADMNQKLLYCEDVRTGTGREVVAFFNGKKYEVLEETLDQSRVFRLQDPKNEVEIGAYGCMVVYTGLREQALTVPNEAVNNRGLERYVYVQGDDGIDERTVKTGLTDGMYTEILAGLEEGERVLYDGEAFQASGTVVLEKGNSAKPYYMNGAELYFPLQYNVCSGIEHGTMLFQAWPDYRGTLADGTEVRGSMARIRNVPVRAGDLIAKISVRLSDAERQQMAKLESDLKRAKERLDDLIAADDEGNEKEIESRRETIADMEESLAELRADCSMTEVRAGRSGRILRVAANFYDPAIKAPRQLAEGDELDAEYSFAVIAEESVAYLPLTNPGSYGRLGYNTMLTVQYQNWKNEMVSREAPVVPFSQSGGKERQQALLLDEDIIKDMNVQGRTINVSGYEGIMNNVVMIPAKAAARVEGSLYYVNVLLEDGTIKPTGVIVGGSCTIGEDAEGYWVIDGVTEGMTVCWE